MDIPWKIQTEIWVYVHYKLVSRQKKSLFEKCEYANEQFGKAHCLILLHSGRNRNLSNEAIFDSCNESRKVWRINIYSIYNHLTVLL